MPDRTRGSATLDKAQRRLAQLQSVDEKLDLGFGLTLETYNQLADKTHTIDLIGNKKRNQFITQSHQFL
jgi:hypothetical protein